MITLKKAFQLLGLFTIVCFSFFITEKTVTVVKEQDPIMIKLEEIKKDYYQPPINAIIRESTIIPGISGQEVDINKSYQNIKKVGYFDTNLLKYKEVKPTISITNNQDKYIIKGNPKFNQIALLFIIDKNTPLQKLTTILNGIKVNYFITADYLTENLNTIKTLSINNEIYNYGYNGNYTESLLTFSNNLINRNTNNKAIYCLTKEENEDIIKTCNIVSNHVIKPSIITTNTPYNEIKNNITNGVIILVNINETSLNELPHIINFIISKGYKIVTLSTMLNENKQNFDS